MKTLPTLTCAVNDIAWLSFALGGNFNLDILLTQIRKQIPNEIKNECSELSFHAKLALCWPWRLEKCPFCVCSFEAITINN